MTLFALVMSLLLFPNVLMAQQNLREGYVITLSGDTLRGVIDFRTAAINTKKCVFKQNGATTFTTYLPGEIEGYRFTSNGIYYVSKEITMKGKDKEKVFAEYVLHGNMNLYQVGSDEMVIEDEDGKQASFSLNTARDATSADELRAEIGDAIRMLSKSEKAGNMLWKTDKVRSNTEKAVKEYVKEMCPDGTCESFEYKSKSTPEEDRVMHPWIKVGFKATQYKFKSYGSITGFSPQISVGADFHLNRLVKGLMINFGLAFEPGRASRDASEVRDDLDPLEQNKIPIKVKFNQFDAMFGPGYQFQTGKLKTSVKAGIIYRVISHNLESTLGYYSVNEGCEVPNVGQENIEWRFDSQMGYYGGVGLEYPIGKFSLTCDFEYIYDFNIWSKYARPWVTIFKQQGLCLSVGLKY